jgi:hypothetical protein
MLKSEVAAPMKQSRNKLADEALADGAPSTGPMIVVAGIATIAVAYLVLPDWGQFAGAMSAAIVFWIVVHFAISVWRRRQHSDAERQRLRELPYPITNVDDYLAELGEERRKSVVVIKASFRERLSSAEVRRVGDAALGLLEYGEATCSDSQLVFNVILRTWYPPPHGQTQGSRNSNVAVHRWLRKEVLAVVDKIHQEHECGSIRIDITETF